MNENRAQENMEDQDFESVFDEIADLSADDIRKKAHSAKSMQGRLKKEEARAREMEDKIQQAEGQESEVRGQESAVREQENDEFTGEAVQGEAQGDEPRAPETESKPETLNAETQDKPSEESDQKQEPGQEPAISEDERKKAADLEVIVEQLRRQQEYNRALENRIRAMERASAPAPGTPGPDAPRQQAPEPAPKKVAIPDELAKDAEEFQRRYPDLYADLEEDSPAGNDMREALRDYGPLQAAGVAKQKRLEDQLKAAREETRQSREQMLQTMHRQETQGHFARLAEKHPEMAWKDDPRKQEDFRAFALELNQWIETLPYREATDALRIRDKGSTREGIELLNRFKDSRNGTGADNNKQPSPAPDKTPASGQTQAAPDPAKQKEKDDIISAAEAVPARPAPPKAPRPNLNDFDGAWEEAVRDKQ